MEEQNQENAKEPEVIIENPNTGATAQKKDEGEKAPAGLKVLSFFIPLAGLILFAVNYSDKPRYAKGCGICALIGFFVIPIVIILIAFLLIFATGFMIYSTADQSVMNASSSLEAQVVESFNSTFERYEGTQTYVAVRSLMSTVSNHNLAYDDHQITVTLDGKEKTPSAARLEIVSGNSYQVKFGYDLSGYIDEIEITTVA